MPGFGDPSARVLILGLAPAAHGANRTGRVFTGDGVGASGDFLMAALQRAGFANISTSQRVDDGLTLTRRRTSPRPCAARRRRTSRCPKKSSAACRISPTRVAHLPRLQVVVALGKIAWDAWLKLLTTSGSALPRPRPAFGARRQVDVRSTDWPLHCTLVGAYHPSRQNTNTGVLTPRMYD